MIRIIFDLWWSRTVLLGGADLHLLNRVRLFIFSVLLFDSQDIRRAGRRALVIIAVDVSSVRVHVIHYQTWQAVRGQRWQFVQVRGQGDAGGEVAPQLVGQYSQLMCLLVPLVYGNASIPDLLEDGVEPVSREVVSVIFQEVADSYNFLVDIRTPRVTYGSYTYLLYYFVLKETSINVPKSFMIPCNLIGTNLLFSINE